MSYNERMKKTIKRLAIVEFILFLICGIIVFLFNNHKYKSDNFAGICIVIAVILIACICIFYMILGLSFKLNENKKDLKCIREYLTEDYVPILLRNADIVMRNGGGSDKLLFTLRNIIDNDIRFFANIDSNNIVTVVGRDNKDNDIYIESFTCYSTFWSAFNIL